MAVTQDLMVSHNVYRVYLEYYLTFLVIYVVSESVFTLVCISLRNNTNFMIRYFLLFQSVSIIPEQGQTSPHLSDDLWCYI